MALNSFGCTNEYAYGFATMASRAAPISRPAAKVSDIISEKVYAYLATNGISPQDLAGLPTKDKNDLLREARSIVHPYPRSL